MTEVQNVTANQHPGTTSREELISANEVILAMVKAAKGLRMYLPNNPVLIGFLEDLHAKMGEHVGSFGDFRLAVEQFALRYKGCDVYENQDPRESIALRLHSDGIRVLTFTQGLEQRELSGFLGIVGFAGPIHQDDDVVTQLWERNLPHISCLLAEDLAGDQEEDQAATAPQQNAISHVYAALAGQLHPPAPPMAKHLLMLTGEEAAWLRKAKQAEGHRNHLDDVVNIVCAVLAGARDAVIFRDFVEIMGKLTANMFLAGEFGHALRLVRFQHKLLNLISLTPDQQQQVKKSLAGVLSERTTQVLQETLDGGDSISHEELKELLQIFGLPSLRAICELLGRVEKLKMRKVIIEVLVELGRNNPEVFSPFLADPRWYLVRNVVLILSMLDTPIALEMIVGLISHRELRIRREVLSFLERSSDPKAKTYILKFLRDDSSVLRIKALQILTRERHPSALKLALSVSAGDDFKARDMAEKKAVFEAIGELGSQEMVPLFREMLLKKQWFKRGIDKDAAICAVAGLLKMNNAAAKQLLEEARGQRSLEIRGIIEQAILANAATVNGRAQA